MICIDHVTDVLAEKSCLGFDFTHGFYSENKSRSASNRRPAFANSLHFVQNFKGTKEKSMGISSCFLNSNETVDLFNGTRKSNSSMNGTSPIFTERRRGIYQGIVNEYTGDVTPKDQGRQNRCDSCIPSSRILNIPSTANTANLLDTMDDRKKKDTSSKDKDSTNEDRKSSGTIQIQRLDSDLILLERLEKFQFPAAFPSQNNIDRRFLFGQNFSSNTVNQFLTSGSFSESSDDDSDPEDNESNYNKRKASSKNNTAQGKEAVKTSSTTSGSVGAKEGSGEIEEGKKSEADRDDDDDDDDDDDPNKKGKLPDEVIGITESKSKKEAKKEEEADDEKQSEKEGRGLINEKNNEEVKERKDGSHVKESHKVLNNEVSSESTESLNKIPIEKEVEEDGQNDKEAVENDGLLNRAKSIFTSTFNKSKRFIGSFSSQKFENENDDDKSGEPIATGEETTKESAPIVKTEVKKRSITDVIKGVFTKAKPNETAVASDRDQVVAVLAPDTMDAKEELKNPGATGGYLSLLGWKKKKSNHNIDSVDVTEKGDEELQVEVSADTEVKDLDTPVENSVHKKSSVSFSPDVTFDIITDGNCKKPEGIAGRRGVDVNEDDILTKMEGPKVPILESSRTLKDTNLESYGSTEHHQAVERSAIADPELAGAGKKVGLEIWRVENKATTVDAIELGLKYEKTYVQFGLRRWPSKDYGKFYEGDSYVVLNTYQDRVEEGKFVYDLHFWLGKYSTADERGVAAYKAVELDEKLDNLPIQHRETQGNETSLFASYFKRTGLSYLKGGIDSGFVNVYDTKKEYKKRLYIIQQHRKAIKSIEIECKFDNLYKGGSYVLDAGVEVFTFFGTNSRNIERFHASVVCNNILAGRFGHSRKAKDSEIFNNFFPGISNVESINCEKLVNEKEKSELAFKDSEIVGNSSVKVFRISDESGNLEFTREDEEHCKRFGRIRMSYFEENKKDVFLIHSNTSIFVWIGSGASEQEKSKAMDIADKYMQSYNIDENFPVTRLTQYQSFRSNAFRSLFGGH